MEQKIIQIGNSIGVIIPQVLSKGTTLLKVGDKVLVSKKGSSFIITHKKKPQAKGVTPKFMQMVDDFMTSHDDVLRELANR